MITADTLNQVAALLQTTDKNTVFTVVVGTLLKQGVDIKVAVELLFGEGSFEKMAGQIYDALRAA